MAAPCTKACWPLLQTNKQRQAVPRLVQSTLCKEALLEIKLLSPATAACLSGWEQRKQLLRACARAAGLMHHGVQLAEQVRACLSCAATWCTRGETSRPGDSCTLCGPRLVCSACSASQRSGIVHGYTRVWSAALRQAKQAQLSAESRCRAARPPMRAAPAPRRGAPAPRRSARGKWRRPYTHASGQSACGQPGGTNETHNRAPRAVRLRGRRRGRARAPMACALPAGLALGGTGARVAPTLIDVSPGLFNVVAAGADASPAQVSVSSAPVRAAPGYAAARLSTAQARR